MATLFTHTIRVLGRELQVKSAAPAELVAEVETLVNEKLAEANRSLNGGDTQLVVILTLMNLAEALVTARRAHDDESRSLNERAAALIARLDAQAG